MRKSGNNAGLRASLQELVRLGSPVDVSVADAEDENQRVKCLELEIERIGRQSHIFSLKNGAAAYMAHVRITNQTKKPIYPLEVELRDLLGDSLVDWLDPSRVPIRHREKADSSELVYKFPQARELAYDEVLNHILLSRRGLMPGRPYEGWLLGTGEPGLQLGGKVQELVLTITGSDHAEYSRTIPFWVDRPSPQPKPAMARPVSPVEPNGGTGIKDLSQMEPLLAAAGFPGSCSLYKSDEKIADT